MTAPDQRLKLAIELARQMQAKRLQRIGEPVPASSVPFQELPDEDQRNWLDLADVVLQRDTGTPPTAKLRAQAADYDKYTQALGHDPGWRDEMRRSVVIEMRAELERLWNECADPLRR